MCLGTGLRWPESPWGVPSARVDSSASLVPRMRSPGVVLDVSGGRTLYVATTGTTATLRLHDNADAADVAISSVPTPAGYVQTSFFGNARLTPFGCIYSTGDWGSYRLQEYRGGAALDLGVALDFLIDATGRYALIQRGSSESSCVT